MRHPWRIPPLEGGGPETEVVLTNGSAVFVVGSNGSGKSALITQLSKSTGGLKVTRIAAHRQSWLQSSSVDLTPKTRRDLERNINTRDRQDEARWKDDYAQPRTQVALYDLANAQNRVSREVFALLKADSVEEATTAAKLPSPLESINNILAISSLTVQLSINDDGDILASHDGASNFSISQLSDGERNAVMLAAQILTAEPETLFLIDEPERHLHRSITEPMLSALFEKRSDCCFVIATHEPELPNCNLDARVVIVRGCSWNGAVASGWDVDILEPGVDVPDDVRRAILGARRRILFVEGETQSLDFPLISALYPSLSIVPRGSCTEVDRSVVGLAGTAALHWLSPIGLVDRDDRTEKEVAELEAKQVFALEVSAIESIFYSSRSLHEMAAVQADIFGIDAAALAAAANQAALSVLDQETKEVLAARRAEKTARNRMLSSLPTWREIREQRGAQLRVEIETTFQAELDRLDALIAASDLNSIVARYAIKKTRMPQVISDTLRFSTKRHYEEAVVARAKKKVDFNRALRGLLGTLDGYLTALD
ncbi:AAA family ATPase [Albidovulum sediminis]|uniref:AAA family ATPase n=1 Tax=Albidovulum sediminis TaxID=3066345 RepID=A0ABT2NK68_9RHOB|nr:AAA family ATPase [Defluviimonas sediminis]MCT8327920.1 AAA family ATPase [Defluviimonas sediminis]